MEYHARQRKIVLEIQWEGSYKNAAADGNFGVTKIRLINNFVSVNGHTNGQYVMISKI